MDVDVAVSGERDTAAAGQQRVVPPEPRRLEHDDGVRRTADRQDRVEAGHFVDERRRLRRQRTTDAFEKKQHPPCRFIFVDVISQTISLFAPDHEDPTPSTTGVLDLRKTGRVRLSAAVVLPFDRLCMVS